MNAFHLHILAAILFGSTITSVFSEDIYSETYIPGHRHFLSLSKEEIEAQKVYDLKETPLPISIEKAGQTALATQTSISSVIGFKRCQIDSATLKQYRAPTGHDDFGKFYYLVNIRSIAQDTKGALWSFHTYLAVFPDGQVRSLRSEDKSAKAAVSDTIPSKLRYLSDDPFEGYAQKVHSQALGAVTSGRLPEPAYLVPHQKAEQGAAANP